MSEETKQAPPAWLIMLARRCVERIESTQRSPRGVNADRAALDYFCGACAALDEAGAVQCDSIQGRAIAADLKQKAEHVGRVAAFLVAIRGVAYVRELAAHETAGVAR